jgi:hypothetical protein
VNRFNGYSQVVSTSNYNILRITVTITHKMNSSMSAYESLLGNTSNIESSILNPLSLSLSLSLYFFWFLDWSLVSNLLLLSRTESRTELTSCGPNIEHPVRQLIPLLFSVATKHVTISGQRVDLYMRIRCRGNMFRLAVF